MGGEGGHALRSLQVVGVVLIHHVVAFEADEGIILAGLNTDRLFVSLLSGLDACGQVVEFGVAEIPVVDSKHSLVIDAADLVVEFLRDAAGVGAHGERFGVEAVLEEVVECHLELLEAGSFVGRSFIHEPVVGVGVNIKGGAAPVAEVGPAGAFSVVGFFRAEHHGAALRVNLTVLTINLLTRILGVNFRHFSRALESIAVAQRVTARVDVLLVAHILEHVDGSAIGSGINLLELVDTGGVNFSEVAA